MTAQLMQLKCWEIGIDGSKVQKPQSMVGD